MKIDKHLAHILSDFCSDLAKAYFIATFVTPQIIIIASPQDALLMLTRGVGNVTI